MMFNICVRCGEYRADKIIEPGPVAVCPECGHRHPFRQLPLLVVSGASGVGKSTVLGELLGSVDKAVLLEADLLWRKEFDDPDTGFNDFHETCLRVCKNISQAGRPVVLFGAGIGVPANLERSHERRYFSEVHYLALSCSEEAQRRRLADRPSWRESAHHAEQQIEFNRWFRERREGTAEAMTLLDTTTASVGETTKAVRAWIAEHAGP